MAHVNPAYQFSLRWFLSVYKTALEGCKTPHAKTPEERLNALTRAVTLASHRSASRSLHDRDKLLFSLIVAVRLLHASKQISDLEWKLFVYGNTGKTLHGKVRGVMAALRMQKMLGGIKNAAEEVNNSVKPEGDGEEASHQPHATTAVGPGTTLASLLRKKPSADSAGLKRGSGSGDRSQLSSAGGGLLKGLMGANRRPTYERPMWLPESIWSSVVNLSELPNFAGLARDICGHPDQWETVQM